MKHIRKYNLFINENKLYNDIEQVSNKIKQECSEYLKEIKELRKEINKDVFLIRGYFSYKQSNYLEIPDIIEKEVRKDREPLDTSPKLQKIIDDKFFYKFGVKPRSGSLFTTFNLSAASQYGKVYMIFPIGEFSYCYSKKIPDLNLYLKDILDEEDYDEEDYDDYYENKSNIDVENITLDDFKKLKVGELSDSEYIIYIDRLKSMPKNISNEIWDNVMKFGVGYDKSDEQLDEIVNSYSLFNSGDYQLEGALSNSSEVMILCDKYYMVSIDHIETINKLIFE